MQTRTVEFFAPIRRLNRRDGVLRLGDSFYQAVKVKYGDVTGVLIQLGHEGIPQTRPEYIRSAEAEEGMAWGHPAPPERNDKPLKSMLDQLNFQPPVAIMDLNTEESGEQYVEVGAVVTGFIERREARNRDPGMQHFVGVGYVHPMDSRIRLSRGDADGCQVRAVVQFERDQVGQWCPVDVVRLESLRLASSAFRTPGFQELDPAPAEAEELAEEEETAEAAS